MSCRSAAQPAMAASCFRRWVVEQPRTHTSPGRVLRLMLYSGTRWYLLDVFAIASKKGKVREALGLSGTQWDGPS
eukprot:scaffold7016_cov123-Isochrysis_galbana.AAC.8